MNQLTVRQKVQNGIDWLDEHAPGWERRIDLSTLNLYRGCDCVLGQVFQEEAKESGWSSSEEDTLRIDAYLWATNRWILAVYSLGFVGTSHSEWVLLSREWRERIKQRFDSGLLSDLKETDDIGGTP